MELTIRIDPALAASLARLTAAVNDVMADKWTIETMAASLLEHVLIDDEVTHVIH